MSTSTSIAATTAASSSPPPPPDEPDANTSSSTSGQEHRPNTPVVMESAHDTDEHAQTKEANDVSKDGEVVYTPASTISSSKGDSIYEGDDNSAEPAEDPNAVWGEWWKAEELTAQVGSLSKELTELKVMISKQALDEEANDMSRLKANHRSSLASLAEFHRSEMAGLNASHIEVMKKTELQHMEELRDARRNSGHDRDLVQGLHQSYSKQIESLVLDLSEARREVKEMKLKQPLSVSTEVPLPIDPALEEVSSRTLSMKLTFDNLDDPFSTVELSVPHPGPSFDAMLRILSFTVKNHLQTLCDTANFFICRPREEHVEAAMKIKHWYDSALEEKVHFSFTAEDNAIGTSMQDRWESGQWKSDEFVLGVLCTAESWESFQIPVFPPELRDDDTVVHEPVEPESPTEKLVSLESTTGEAFNPAAELERINRELGNLQLHQQLQEQADRELQNYDEDKENCEPPLFKSMKATVESVRDEDELSLGAGSTSLSEGVPIIKLPKPRQRQETSNPTAPLIWEDGQTEPVARTINVSLEDGLKEFLVKDVEKAQIKGKGLGSGDSWLFDELFATIPVSQGKDKEGEADTASTYPKNIIEEANIKEPRPFTDSSVSIDPLISKDGGMNRRHPRFGWRWLLPDSVKSPQLVSVGTDSHPVARATKLTELPQRETYVQALTKDGDSMDKNETQYFHDQQAREYAAEHPLFSFADSQPSPAPPPAPQAPEASTRDSPTLPAYFQTDIGTSHDQGESAHGNDDSIEAADIPRPFSGHQSGDTPVMETAQSVVSSTPLLGSDATGHKSVHFRTKKRSYPTTENSGQRMPQPPFPPTSGGLRDNGSPRSSKYSVSNYEREGYGDINGASQVPDDRWENSQSSASWKSESAQGEKKCGFGQGTEAYTWRRNLEQEEEGYRPRSVLSRSSTTTTDRRSEFIVPPKSYPQVSAGNNIGPFRYGFGMRPMAMGPLGPRSGVPTFANPQHADMLFQQQMREIFGSAAANNFGAPARSSTGPPYGGGPVYAPNPPHSVAARSGGGGGVPVGSPYPNGQGNGSVVAGSVVNGSAMNGLTRYPFDPWPTPTIPMHMPHHHHHHHMFSSNGEPRRSFSNDSISPLLWNTQNPMVMRESEQSMPMPVMSQQQQGHSPSNSNHEQPQSYPGMMAPWALGGNIGQLQSNTPVSQVSMHPQGWFQQQSAPPFEVSWDGGPIPMRMPGPWAGGYSA